MLSKFMVQRVLTAALCFSCTQSEDIQMKLFCKTNGMRESAVLEQGLIPVQVSSLEICCVFAGGTARSLMTNMKLMFQGKAKTVHHKEFPV